MKLNKGHIYAVRLDSKLFAGTGVRVPENPSLPGQVMRGDNANNGFLNPFGGGGGGGAATSNVVVASAHEEYQQTAEDMDLAEPGRGGHGVGGASGAYGNMEARGAARVWGWAPCGIRSQPVYNNPRQSGKTRGNVS